MKICKTLKYDGRWKPTKEERKRNWEIILWKNLLLCLPANLLDGGERRWIGLEEGDTPEKKRESKRRKGRKEMLLSKKKGINMAGTGTTGTTPGEIGLITACYNINVSGNQDWILNRWLRSVIYVSRM